MTTLTRMARFAGMAAILAAGSMSAAHGGAMYTVMDVGKDGNQFIGLDNLFGRRLLGLNASGQIISPSGDPLAGTYLGPLPTGMRPLSGFESHASTDGQYQVVTAFADASPAAPWAGVVVHQGVATPIGTLGGPFSAAFGVNNEGKVVGESSPTSSEPSHAVVVDPKGKMTDLGKLGTGNTAALAINNKGTIVGQGADGFNVSRAFVSDGLTLTDLNTLIDPIKGFSLISATAINDAGQIAAYGRFANDPVEIYHEILLSPIALGVESILPVPTPTPDGNMPIPSALLQPSPVPEPATITLFACIAGVVLIRSRLSGTRAQR